MIPYPAYKSTNLPWLPEIPEHWGLVRCKQIFRPIDVRSEKGEEQLLSVSERYGVVKREQANVTMFKAASYEGYKLCWPDDLAINSLWAWSYGLGFSPYHGIISTAYSVFRLKDKTKCLPRFYDYLVRSKDFHWELRVRSKGLWKSRYQLSDDAFLATPILDVPIAEQEQIVRYLDAMTAKINKLIRAKKKQIALLQEQCQAIINRAVTKGLDTNVEMKDSGIDWLGEIPTSWGTCRCKYLFRETNNRSVSGQEEHLSMSQKYGLIPDSRLDGHHLLSESYEGGKICQKDDLVLNRLKAHLGVFALAPQKGVVSPDYTIFHVRKDTIEPLFAEYVLKSQKCRPELKLRVRGIVEGFWRLYTDDFYNITLPLPPLAVQKELLDAIEKQTESINKTISLFEEEISTLKEYHDICVSSVVTGQTDVRNIPVEDVIPDELIPDDAPTSEIEEEPTEESEE